MDYDQPLTKVYVVTDGCYSDYHIVGIYTDKAKAEQRHLVENCENEIEEWPLDEMPAYPIGLLPWHVMMDAAGNTSEAYRRGPVDDDGDPDPVFEWDWRAKKVNRHATFLVWARDRDHAIKIVNERRLQLLASGDWKRLERESDEECKRFLRA